MHLLIGIIFILATSTPALSRRFREEYHFGPGGNITSPGYPDDYPNYIHWHWYIIVEPDSTIELEFLDFQLEDPSDGSLECDTDFVMITQPNGIRSDRYCGTDKPPKMTSLGSRLQVDLITDETERFRGFLARYKEIPLYPITTASTTTRTTTTQATGTTTTTVAPTTTANSTTGCAGQGGHCGKDCSEILVDTNADLCPISQVCCIRGSSDCRDSFKGICFNPAHLKCKTLIMPDPNDYKLCPKNEKCCVDKKNV